MRRGVRPELTLLLAVAPLVACRGEPEDRHCVDAEGRYVNDWGCEPGHPAYVGGSHWVYVPRNLYSGPGTSAGPFRGSTSPGSGHAAVSRGGFGGTAAGHAGS